MNHPKTKYRRVILKISGETLGERGAEVIDVGALNLLTAKIREATNSGVQIGIVCGGGNIIRGKFSSDSRIARTTADQMGMLATVINSMVIRDIIEKEGIDVRLFSSLAIAPLAEPYLPRNARQALDNGAVVIFSGGTGNPFVSTDTAAVLRACDIGADAVLKATKVDGVYTGDPNTDPDAQRYDRISYDEALEKGLAIMDLPAIALARENSIPVIVFDFWGEKSIERVLRGDNIGTVMV
jgi:uridylate kinase